MKNPHGTHSTASVVEDPFLIQVYPTGDHFVELGNDVLGYAPGVIAVLCNGALGQVMDVLMVKDVKLVQILLENVPNWCKNCKQGDNADEPAPLGDRRWRGRHWIE